MFSSKTWPMIVNFSFFGTNFVVTGSGSASEFGPGKRPRAGPKNWKVSVSLCITFSQTHRTYHGKCQRLYLTWLHTCPICQHLKTHTKLFYSFYRKQLVPFDFWRAGDPFWSCQCRGCRSYPSSVQRWVAQALSAWPTGRRNLIKGTVSHVIGTISYSGYFKNCS